MNKKIFRSSIVLGSALFMFIMAPSAMAGYIGNPLATVDEGEMALGLVHDMVNRDYGKAEDDVDTDRTLLKGIYGVIDGLDVYAMLGKTKVEDDGSGTGIGLGLKKNLELGDFDCGFVLQALKYDSDNADQTDIDVALGTTREVVNDMVVYGGATFSTDSGDADESDQLGIFIGAEYPLTSELAVGGEFRAICETSISLAVTYAFD